MSDADRKTLAAKVIKMRNKGKSWKDIKEATGIRTAVVGRALIREFGDASTIRPGPSRKGGDAA